MAAAARVWRRWSLFLLRGPSPPALRVLGVALGLTALKDLLWSLVYYPAIAFPQRFVLPYLGVPRIPYDGLGARVSSSLQLAATLGALGLVSGVLPRPGAALLLGCYGYGFVADSLAYTNNLYLFLVLLTAYLLGSGGDPRAAAAAGRGAQLFVASIYVTGAVTKLSAIWLSGTILREALFYYQSVYTRWVNLDVPWAFEAGAWATIAVELFLAFGLWHRRTRRWAAAVGVALHAGIELFLPVRMFSYLMVGSYALFLDRGALRRVDGAIEATAPWVRALAGLGAMLLLNRLFVQLTGNYEYTAQADWPLLLSFGALGLVAFVREPGAAPRATRGAAWPALRAGLPLLLALHGAMLLKPLGGRPTDFSFRLFSELVLVRVELWVRRDGDWGREALFGAAQRWGPQYRYTWGSWSDERVFLDAYARWLAANLDDAEALRLEAHVSRDRRPVFVERWELPAARPPP